MNIPRVQSSLLISRALLVLICSTVYVPAGMVFSPTVKSNGIVARSLSPELAAKEATAISNDRDTTKNSLSACFLIRPPCLVDGGSEGSPPPGFPQGANFGPPRWE